MAVAARPGPSDARVPCPLCGGLIHPIAGKCKHCKADLTSYHAARPAANAQLPALHPPAPSQAHDGNGHAAGYGPTDAAHGPVAHAVAPVVPAAMYEASQPVLPARPTRRSYPTEPRTSGWRSWPVVVIVIAMVAIVVAVVLMVWPASAWRDGGSKHTMAPPPAPERMQTEPQIAPPQPDRNARPVPPAHDPWGPGPVAPRPADPGAQGADPLDPIDRADPNDPGGDLGLVNPFDSPHAPPHRPANRRHLKLNRRGSALAVMAEHLCKKLVQCGNDDPMAKTMCAPSLAHGPSLPPANCPAADRCFEAIDTMSCATQSDEPAQLNTLMMQFTDCAEAVRC